MGHLQIDDYLKEKLQADCTKFAPGMEIVSVRVTKPRLPPAIEANYEAMEAERTRVCTHFHCADEPLDI